MFTHILIPTDGSACGDAAAVTALRLARDARAKVTGIHVIAPYHVFSTTVAMLEDTREQYARDSKDHALKILAVLKQVAHELGVVCDTVYAVSDHPYQAIIDAATHHRCDLIAMAAHGHRGAQAVLLGSETQKVLTHSTLPVLVLR